jgi:hypothetical protein
MLIATAFAAVVVLAAVPAYITLGGHRVASISTAEALDQVAEAAVDNPLPFARADQYQYTRSRGTYVTTAAGGYNSVTKKNTKSFSALVTNERRAWISLDRPGALKERRVGVKWVTARDRRIAREGYDPNVLGPAGTGVTGMAPDRRYYFLGREMTRSQLEHAPTDPKVIYGLTLKRLNGAGQGPADGVWQALTEQLYEYSYPPAVRAGMVRALGLIPGVKTLGRMRDPLGREGIAFSREHYDERDVILFNDTNSALMYQRSSIFQKTQKFTTWPIGTITSDYLAYEQRVVDDVPTAVLNKLPKPKHRVRVGPHTNVGLVGN